jgi:membrane fusion protein, multidrug efflux system
MRKTILIVVVVAAGAAGAWYYQAGGDGSTAAPGQSAGPGRGASPKTALTVGSATATRHEMADYITAVGNLIGEATVDVVPRTAGRIDQVFVRLGDRVTRGQPIAELENREIQEQVNQAQANLQVNQATVAQRDSDLKVAQTTLDRTQAAFDHGLTAKQNLEDAQARYNSAVAQVAVAKAQLAQTRARIDELKINLSNTEIVSPVDGFVGRRNLDPGAFAGTNTPIVSVVAINTVRLVANLIEKDFRRVQPGVEAAVEVDAFPGETFLGRVSRVAPVFDPATRTATMEIEVPNPGHRLKPGMYARVRLTAERHPNALTVPRDAVVDLDGQRGVYLVDGQTARYRVVHTGLQNTEAVEVLDGLTDGQRVVTVGALALRDGDRIQLATTDAGGSVGRDSAPNKD